jgi:sortase A
VITAHRDTHFSALRYVGPGDVITLQRPDGRNVRYRVQATRVVNKSDMSVLRQDSRTRLTLITCYPFDAVRPGTPLRWVVVAQKVG